MSLKTNNDMEQATQKLLKIVINAVFILRKIVIFKLKNNIFIIICDIFLTKIMNKIKMVKFPLF